MKKHFENIHREKNSKLTLEGSMDLIVDSLWREANTRRPTLPPSALIMTAAAKQILVIEIIQLDFKN